MNKKTVGILAAVALVAWSVNMLQSATVLLNKAPYKQWFKVKVKEDDYRHRAYIHPDYAAIFGVTNKQVLTMEEFENLRNPVQFEPDWRVGQPDVDP